MKFLGMREMRAGSDALKELLEREGEVIVTHRGKPFARVLPCFGSVRKMPSLKQFRARQKRQEVPSSVSIRKARDLQ